MNTISPEEARIRELEDQLKAAERQISDLKIEVQEARQLVEDMEENVQDGRDLIDGWIEAFDMQLDDSGLWQFDTWVDGCGQWRERYYDLLKKWNDLVPKWNNLVRERMPIGRPIAASDAQIANVRKLRKGGMSLRNIATETNLGMQTVRTIIGKAAGSDRATMKRLERLDPERADLAAWKARKRTRDALPKKIAETLETGAALIKAAKGLGG